MEGRAAQVPISGPLEDEIDLPDDHCPEDDQEGVYEEVDPVLEGRTGRTVRQLPLDQCSQEDEDEKDLQRVDEEEADGRP